MARRATAGKGHKAKPAVTTEPPRGYASPACLMHEVDPAYFGFERADEPGATAKTGGGAGRRRRATGKTAKTGNTGKKDKNP